MCGISGFVSLSGAPVAPGALALMNTTLAHRGPDGSGFLLAVGVPDGFAHVHVPGTALPPDAPPALVGLAHRRLAILDLSDRGLQPMTCDGLQWLVFNGEIYNHRALRDELQTLGARFTSRTDTEVLLHAYRQWGDACLDHLEGMFAFAMWDAVRGRLFCARDRLGIKPFYYAVTNSGLAFASEIKALFDFPGIRSDADDDVVLGFLVHGNCDIAGKTIFRQVRTLPAGHSLAASVGSTRLDIARYWEIAPTSSDVPEQDRVAHLLALLRSAMRDHLVSDVRAGSCLSGGLDSSTVVTLAAELRRNDPAAATALGREFYAFTSCYEDMPRIDERRFALSVARATGATPVLVFPSPDDFWTDFARLAWHQDMPFASMSFYAQWRVMRAARDAGVRVLLDGQGGDEVFGGYAKVRYAYLANLLRSRRIGAAAREIAATIGQHDRYVLDLRNGVRYLPPWLRRALQVDSALEHCLRPGWQRALSAEATPATRWWRYVRAAIPDGHAWSPAQRVQIDDITTDTLPSLLRMEDRSSMAFAIEARVPLLDHRVVEYGLSLPDDLKVHDGWSKCAVREAMRGLLPEDVRLRTSKLAFEAPDRAWLNGALRPVVTDLVTGPLRCARYVDPEALRAWYGSPAAAHGNQGSFLGLFRIPSLEMWMRAFHVN
jgi:asparagine synthase (glutamine-hydrolysing)